MSDNVIELDPWKDLPPMVRQYMGTKHEAEALRIYEQAKEEAKRQIVEETYTEAYEAERKRCIGIAKLFFGEKEGARLEAMVQSGMTPEQYRNLKPQIEAAGENPELKALRLVHSALTRPTAEADFMGAVDKIMDAEKITKTEAMARVATQQPELHKRYLEARNPGRQLDL